MKRLPAVTAALLFVVVTAFGCAHLREEGWVTLIDGEKGLENWTRLGDANWRAYRGAIVGDWGKGGRLVSKNSYKDFVLRVEFWADHTTNSGIYIRATNPKNISSASAYEVQIYDQRHDGFGTGALLPVASVKPGHTVGGIGGKWNVYEITAQGPELTVSLNGQVTVYVRDDKYPQGPIALQWSNGPKGVPGGPIRWRKVQIKAL